MRNTVTCALLIVLVLMWPEGARVVADVFVVGSEFQINSVPLFGADVFPSLAAFADGDFVVTWSENVEVFSSPPLRAEIMARQFDANAEPLGPELIANTYTTGWQGFPRVAALDEGFVIVWESDPQSREMPQFGALRQFDRDGIPLKEEETRFTDRADDPIVWTAPDGGYAIAWDPTGGRQGFLVQRFDGHGMPAANAIAIGYPFALTRLSDDSFVAVFAERCSGSGSSRVSALRINDAGEAGSAFQVNTTSPASNPSVRVDSTGGFVVTWVRTTPRGRTLVGRRFRVDGTAISDELPLGDPLPAGEEAPPPLSTIDARTVTGPVADQPLLTAFEVDDGSDTGIAARLFDEFGRPIGQELRVNSTTRGMQIRPQVAVDEQGRYVVVWLDLSPALEGNIRAQRLRVDPSSMTPIPDPTPAEACAGDCDGDGTVVLSELDAGIATLFADQGFCSCPHFDVDANDRPTAADLVGSVGSAVSGCSPAPVH